MPRIRVYFRWANQYAVASMEEHDTQTGKRWQSMPESNKLVLPIGEVEEAVQKGQAIIDDSMTFVSSGHQAKRGLALGVGKDGVAAMAGAVQRGKIKMSIAPHADTDGVVRIGWNTDISYLDADASIIKTADTVIGGDFTTNTLLHLCAMTAVGKLVIKEIEIDGSTEAVFAAASPSYVSLNVLGEKTDKRLPFPQPSSKDNDNTIRVYTEKYLSELGVSLEFGGLEYLKITTPKGLTSTVTLTVEFYPQN